MSVTPFTLDRDCSSVVKHTPHNQEVMGSNHAITIIHQTFTVVKFAHKNFKCDPRCLYSALSCEVDL